jgi:hypothetical protein
MQRSAIKGFYRMKSTVNLDYAARNQGYLIVFFNENFACPGFLNGH